MKRSINPYHVYRNALPIGTGLFFIMFAFLAVSCTKHVGTSGDPAPPKDSTSKTDSLPSTSTRTGDIVGKLIVGYQGWFGAPGDHSPFNGWRHWSGTGAPSPGNETFELWPDMREYTASYPTGYDSLGNGLPAKLFSSWDDQSVNLHFKWMKQYGIDCAAIQRFGSHMADDPRDKNFKNGLLQKERTAAENNQVKFFVWYDISGWNDFQAAIKTDWTETVSPDTSSVMYAHQDGKPVVCIWGIGVEGRPGDVNSYSDVINFFKDQGCYVIIGTERGWLGETDYLATFKLADMISPWSVGTFHDESGADNYASVMQGDLAFCQANGQDYLPVVFPGFSWSNWHSGAPKNEIPRMHGDFMWRQFANLRKLKISNAFVAMFDEYDEGTAIAKAAENTTMMPADQYFLTLDADGVAVSSDFYLRLTEDGAKMLKQETELTWQEPTSFK